MESTMGNIIYVKLACTNPWFYHDETGRAVQQPPKKNLRCTPN